MTKSNNSLAQSLIRPLLLWGAMAVLIGTSLSVYIVKAEYEELLDLSLKNKAELLLPLVSSEYDLKPDTTLDPLSQIEGSGLDTEEQALFWLVDTNNQVIVQSRNMPAGLTHDVVDASGYQDGPSHRYFATRQNTQGRRIIVAEPLAERNEVVMDSLMGIALSMLILVLIAVVVIRLAIRHVQRTITRLGDEIGQKNENNLTPIDSAMTFSEFSPATDTINDLMERLGKAIGAERDFATNAAHELRTPLAVSLAHTQRLKANTKDVALLERASEIEAGLKRLVHLVERLLQFSRAQSGLGVSETATDANQVTTLLFTEASQRSDAQGRIVSHPPSGAFFSSVDTDALAIILSNLIDNALKHSPPGGIVNLDGQTAGKIVITNDCDPLSAQDVQKIQQRHERHSTTKDGFGLGMAIVKTLCDQSGCQLTILSPSPGQMRGMTVILQMPAAAGASIAP